MTDVKLHKQEVKKLHEMEHEIRSAISVENVRAMVADNLEYFKVAKKKSWRLDHYRSGKEDQPLFLVISPPFMAEQQDAGSS